MSPSDRERPLESELGVMTVPINRAVSKGMKNTEHLWSQQMVTIIETLTFSDLYPQNEKGEQISLKNGSNHRKPTGLGHKSVLDISARCGYNCTRTGGGHNVG